MSDKDTTTIVDEFDKRVASVWLVIVLGASESVKWLGQFVAGLDSVRVVLFGVDVTLLAVWLALVTVGTTAIIAWRTVGR